jgi:hypothetical protein
VATCFHHEATKITKIAKSFATEPQSTSVRTPPLCGGTLVRHGRNARRSWFLSLCVSAVSVERRTAGVAGRVRTLASPDKTSSVSSVSSVVKLFRGRGSCQCDPGGGETSSHYDL